MILPNVRVPIQQIGGKISLSRKKLTETLSSGYALIGILHSFLLRVYKFEEDTPTVRQTALACSWAFGINFLSLAIDWGEDHFDPTPSIDAVDRRSRVKRASGRITTWTILENWTKGIRIISRIILLNKALRTGYSYTILLSQPTPSIDGVGRRRRVKHWSSPESMTDEEKIWWLLFHFFFSCSTVQSVDSFNFFSNQKDWFVVSLI